jgi:hypothetical protein
MCVLHPDPEVGDCLGNGLYLYYWTGLHATNRVIACSLIYNRNLACGERTRLDGYDVIFAAGELSMAIIMLDRLYFMLSYWLALTDVAPVQHGRRAAVRP